MIDPPPLSCGKFYSKFSNDFSKQCRAIWYSKSPKLNYYSKMHLGISIFIKNFPLVSNDILGLKKMCSQMIHV